MALPRFLLPLLFLLLITPTIISATHPHKSRRANRKCPPRHPPSSSSTTSTTISPTNYPAPSTSAPAHTHTPAPAPAPASPAPIKSVNNNTPLTPNGIKAGIAGGDSYTFMEDHIGWWYDWYVPFFCRLSLVASLNPKYRTPNPSKPGKPIAVPMLWGGGIADAIDASRLAQFKQITSAPKYVLGYEEPDCPSGSGSAGLSVSAGVSDWNSLIAPLGKKGSLLGSPSMCSTCSPRLGCACNY